ncbi:dTMP kinase [Segetibacter sp. 3557_3]|uniref:dTMP kinase n=1 Tax=Segetibacter sp. 3557_3 TaxID=2547429 RepID=UPI001058C260|nr:dTMP kinase [Segetibacter sp. 3557_3]TDH29017.1 dTMP kinase [Segetibacter sp. 3557_3]
MNSARPLFIALEGIDGSGKSTQCRLLTENLRKSGVDVYGTFEPTDGQVGTFIRSILRNKAKADNRTIAGLFVADRLDHLLNDETGIVRKLEWGQTVVTDRYYFSSYAYHGTHMDMEWVIQANSMSASILRPDANIFIDVSPEVCMQRIVAGRESPELYETLDNLLKVRAKYMEAFDKLGPIENIVMINGDQPREQIAADIWQVVTSLQGH